MHRSITGIADALQSIADGKSVLNRKGEGESLKRFQAEVEAARADMESNKRLNEASQYYAEIENCTLRIASRLREIDSIDLMLKPEYDDEDADPVSNQKRFLEDQCFRAQSLLTGEYYLRNLHTQEVNSGMADLDERITYTAKNWKHSLVEIGINESDLIELQPPALEATQEMIPEKSDSRKVRRNSVITQVRPSLVAVEADYSGYNAAELTELNEILSQFMDQTFLNGANGHQLSREVMDRCTRFKDKILGLTNKLVDDQRRSVKSDVRQAQRAVRSLESEIALLHSQNDEADQIIRTQKESDKQIRKLVEAKFADSLQNFADHMRKIDTKLEAQREVSAQAQKRFQEVQSMYRELQSQRLHADPFVRRRAENLVKGLLRNLNESDLKEQEDREAAMLTTYQQWKKTVEFCTEKERQLQLMQVQEASVRQELEMHMQRVAEEREVYRQRVKVLKSKDDEQSAKLRILEETLSEKARNERRKLFFHETALSLQQRNASENPELANAEDSDLAEFEAKLQKAGSEADSEGSSGSHTESSDDLDTGSGASSETEQGSARGRNSPRRRRVKQPGVRTVAPLCDQRTEAVLGVTFEHTKRQEITTNVSDHIPRPVVAAVTGSEATDSAALAKAQKLINTIHVASENAAADPGAYVNAGATNTAPSVKVDGWIESNSAPRTTSVKFNRDSYGAGTTPSSPKRRQSTYSSSKVKFGFWAEAEVNPSSDSSGGYSGSDDECDAARRAGGSAGAVSRATSRGTGSRGGTAGAPGSATGRRPRRNKDRAVAVHSLTSTACYVSLYYRYLKKFPNLNFRRDNPRLEQIGGDPRRSSSPSRNRDGQDNVGRPVVSEIVENNNRFQFTIKEGLIVVKEAIDALFTAKCIDRHIVCESLDKVEELDRRLRLVALPGEEPEVRYQLHYLCVSLIHSILGRAPQLLLLKNSRKLFVEINTTMLALLGVVLNCSLVFWQPSVTRWNAKPGGTKTGGVAVERVEFICAHLVELVLTQGDIDHRRPLGETTDQAPAAGNAGSTKIPARSASSKTFRASKPANTPMGPAGFISLLRIQTGELLRKEREKGFPSPRPAVSPTAAEREAVPRNNNAEDGGDSGHGSSEAAGSADPDPDRVQQPALVSEGSTEATNVYRKSGVMNYHELFQVYNAIVDDDAPIDATVGHEGMFTGKHRHAVLALQLFLYLALGNRDVNISDAILMLHKGIQQHQEGLIGGPLAGSSEADSVIPCDVDILLQSMHPGMVPALLSMELLRRVLEEEFRRVNFLKKIAAAHPQVADLQYLNVQFPGQFDVGLRTGRSSTNTHDGSSKKMEAPVVAAGVLAPPEPLTLGIAPHAQGVSGRAETAVALRGGQLQQSGMRVTRFKSTKEAHMQWVEDLESQLQHLSNQICALIGTTPVGASGSTAAVRPPAFLGQTIAGAAGDNEAPTIPLPVALVYRLLAHINSLRTITASRSVNGFPRVQALEPQFISIMRDLLAARSRILSIVKAMTWPMRKKLDWLKMKYNTILEENVGATKEVTEFNNLVEKYEADIAAYKASLLLVDREKHTIEYRRTRMLQVGQHDPQIQSLIVEHCTDEYAQKLAEVKAREARLNATIAQFSNEFDHLNAQSETLKAAQRSLNVIEQAQTDAEKELDQRPGVHTPVFDPLPGTDDFETIHQPQWPSNPVGGTHVPAKPKAAPVSEFLQAVEAFVKTERMAEAVMPSAFADPRRRGQEEVSAKRVVEEAKAREKQRRLKNAARERAVARPRLPLFGVSAQLQQKPSLPSKLLGFAQRIDSGLVAMGAHGSGTKGGRISTPVTAQRSEVTLDISDSESDTGSHHPMRAKASHRSLAAARSVAGGVYTEGMDKEGMQPDLFGQRKPKSLRDRIQQQMLRKGSGKYATSGSHSGKLRMHDILSRYLLSDCGGPAFEPQRLQREPSDDALVTSDSAAQLDALTGGMITEVQGRRPILKIPSPRVSRDRSEGFIQMPALEQIGRKELAYMSTLHRSKKYHYKEVAYAEVEGLATPLDVKSLIADAIRSQREAAHSRDSVRTADREVVGSAEEGGGVHGGDDGSELQGQGSSKKTTAQQATFTDDVDEDNDDDQFDEEEGAGLEGTGSGKGELSHVRLHGHGVSYAEYLVWKAKRRQQHHETQRLEALKNALNIQMRNARRNKASIDASAAAAEATASTAAELGDKVLTEAEFDQLVQDVSKAAAQLDLEEGSQRMDYTRTNSEVDFILSRCSSRADTVRQNRKFSSKKRASFGGSLHFNTALLAQTDSGNEGTNSAVTEANRRARGESLRSARASLSLRTRATIIQKLGQLVDATNARKAGLGGEVPLSGALASRQSIRHSIVDSLGTIPESSVLRHSVVGRKSMYGKGALAADLPLEEAHIMAHTIVHGAPPPPKKHPGESDELTGSQSSASLQTVSSRINRPFGSRFDMQILNYIANDQLILSGWEEVDLLAMNDNETFSGHSFRFDDVDDRARAAMLKEFAAAVAVMAEKSVSAVESEYQAAIRSLNGLAGKKAKAEEVQRLSPKWQDAALPPSGLEGTLVPPREASADLTVAEALVEQDVVMKTAVPSESAGVASMASPQKSDPHRHHHAILAGLPEGLERASTYQHKHGSSSNLSAPLGASSSTVERDETSTMRAEDGIAGTPREEVRPAAVTTGLLSPSGSSEQPRRPSEPKPSASFASPRKKLTVGFH